MTPEEFEKERRESAKALRRVAEEARGVDVVRSAEDVLGRRPEPKQAEDGPESAKAGPHDWNPLAPPDLKPVNESWPAGGSEAVSRLAGLIDGSSASRHEAQVKFNSDQVQLDNALVSWASDHFGATHKHYDTVIGFMHKRMDEIDTRHRELERELVRHVHEMARRVDVVLGEGEKGRVSHDAALRSIRERLRALEEKLG